MSAAGTTYGSNATGRELELVQGAAPDEDFFSISADLHTLTLNVTFGQVYDEVRVITATAPPELRIDDVTTAEGDAGSTPANFSVSLTHVTSSPVSVTLATADVSASAGADYTALPANTTVSFSPGDLVAGQTVSVLGDTFDEPTETYSSICPTVRRHHGDRDRGDHDR